MTELDSKNSKLILTCEFQVVHGLTSISFTEVTHWFKHFPHTLTNLCSMQNIDMSRIGSTGGTELECYFCTAAHNR